MALPDFYQLAADQSEWSQATFGTDLQRGPIGTLKHLAKEVQECLNEPNDVKEYADCLILILDASRRAGFSADELVAAGLAKMAENRQRQWPPFDPANIDKPVEHVRNLPSDFACVPGVE